MPSGNQAPQQDNTMHEQHDYDQNMLDQYLIPYESLIQL